MDLGQKKKIKGDRYTNRVYLVPHARGNHLKSTNQQPARTKMFVLKAKQLP